MRICWAEALREHVKVVGVFVNPSLAALKEIIGMGLIDVIQLHGDEDSQRVARVMALGLPVIKALQVRDRESLKMIRKYPVRDHSPRCLLSGSVWRRGQNVSLGAGY